MKECSAALFVFFSSMVLHFLSASSCQLTQRETHTTLNVLQTETQQVQFSTFCSLQFQIAAGVSLQLFLHRMVPITPDGQQLE